MLNWRAGTSFANPGERGWRLEGALAGDICSALQGKAQPYRSKLHESANSLRPFRTSSRALTSDRPQRSINGGKKAAETLRWELTSAFTSLVIGQQSLAWLMTVACMLVLTAIKVLKKSPMLLHT